MSKKGLLSVLLFCLAFVSLNAQSGGNGTPPRNPIKFKVKGGDDPGTNSLSGTIQLPVSASCVALIYQNGVIDHAVNVTYCNPDVNNPNKRVIYYDDYCSGETGKSVYSTELTSIYPFQ